MGTVSGVSATAATSGTFAIGGDLPVTRLGYGAMRITGHGIWGPPPHRETALAVLRRLPALGTTSRSSQAAQSRAGWA